MRFDVVSLFPEYLVSPLQVSLLGKAISRSLIEVGSVDLREFGEGKHKRVDQRPYGGGPGMVIQAPPLLSAIRSVKRPATQIVYLDPQGQLFDAATARELAALEHVVLVCGHYEGIDERVFALEPGRRISIGRYVLSSGLPAALVVIDAVSRFIPGVLGNEESVACDSFEKGELEGPQYTDPRVVEGLEVPPVLLSGHHAEVAAWRCSKRAALKS